MNLIQSPSRYTNAGKTTLVKMETPKLSDVKVKDDLLAFNYKILQSFAKVNFLPSNLKKSHLAEVIAAHNSGNKDLVIEKIHFVMKERCLQSKNSAKKKVPPTDLINKYLNKTNSTKKRSSKRSLFNRFNMETRPEGTVKPNVIQTRSMNKIKTEVHDSTKSPNKSRIQVKTIQNFRETIVLTNSSKTTILNDEVKEKEAYLREINLIDSKASVVPKIKTKNIINSTIDLSYKHNLANKMTNRKISQPVITIPKRSIFHTTRLPVNKKLMIKKTQNKTKVKTVSKIPFKFSPKITSTPKVDKQTQYESRKRCKAVDMITDIDNHLHSLIMEFCTQNTEEMTEGIDINGNTHNCTQAEETDKKSQRMTYINHKYFPVQTLPSIDVAFGNMKEKTPEYMKPLYVHVSTESERYEDVKYYFPIYSNTGNLLVKTKEFTPYPNTIATNSSVPLTTPYVNNNYIPTSCGDTSNAIRHDTGGYGNQLCIPDQYNMVSEEISHLFRAYENEVFEEIGTCKNVLKSCEYFDTEGGWRHDSALMNEPSEVDQHSYSDIAQMVEDALYIASTDVKYMESSGMNIHMQCMKCIWAGPRLLLEHHIRLEHDNLIYKSIDFNWMLAVNIQSIIQTNDGLSELIECCEGSIFLVHLKYWSQKLMISLFSLVEEDKTVCAAISIYPKTVGAAVNWHQVVFMLPPVLSNYPHVYCSFDLAELGYLPRSTVEYNYKAASGMSWCNVDVPFFISITFD